MRKRTFALYAVAFVLQLALGCAAHANLLSNGDFESGNTGWSSPMSFFFGRTHPLEPSGSVSGSGLEFRWIPVEGATWYQVWIVMPDKTSLTSWVQGATRWTPDVASFDPGSYTWYVRAWKPDGSGPWSEGAWFSVPSPSSYSWSGSSSVVYYGTRGTNSLPFSTREEYLAWLRLQE